VRDAAYPLVVPAPGERAHGALIVGLRRGDWARLWHYESDDYALLRCVVETPGGTREALVFAGGSTEAGDAPWSLAAWRLRHRAAALVRIRRHMTAFR
jgi:hypothetical protein